MPIKSTRILTLFLRYGVAIFLFFTLIGVMILEDFRTIREPYSFDEHLYKNISNNFTIEHIKFLYTNVMETKPLTFLTLQKILNNSDPFYTRGLNLILIIISTLLIYKITGNKLSFLYIIIPIFLDSMWLTAEIIEVFFVLLSIKYAEKSGIFIGLATIFRPSAILYSLLLKIKQIPYVLGIGTIFASILYFLGLFYPYLFEVTNYAQDGFVGLDLFVVIILIMLIIIGLNKQMLGYVIISSLAFSIKMYPHYFLPIFTFLFMGFLLNMNGDLKELTSINPKLITKISLNIMHR